jgi:hypothetical protein
LRPQYFWPAAFLLLAIITGPSLIFGVPPGHVPDEAGHVSRAASLLYGQLIGHRETDHGQSVEGVITDPAFHAVVTVPVRPLDPHAEPVSPVGKWLATEVPWSTKPTFVGNGSVGGYMPLPYVPEAAAIAVCRLLGLSPLDAFLGARIANFYCFLVIGAAALRLTRRGAALIFCVLMLPMTLSLAASASQDGLIIAGAALASACLSRAAAAEAPLRSRWYAGAGAVLAIVCATKPPYAPLAGLMLIPLRWRPSEFAKGAAACVLVALPSLLWALLEARVAAVPPVRAAAEAGPLWPGPRPAIYPGPDFAAQMQVIAAHPARALSLPLETIAQSTGSLLHQAVGVLDYLSLALPGWLYAAWFVALPAAFLAGQPGPPTPPLRAAAEAALLLLCLLLSATAIGLALYLDWTPVGMPWVAGIQGRYFLPLAAMLGLAAPRRGFGYLAAVPLGVAVADVLVLPRIVAAFYPLQ